MGIYRNYKEVKKVTRALDAVRGELDKDIRIVVMANPQVEGDIIKKLQHNAKKNVVIGLSGVSDEREKQAQLRKADLALVLISPGESNDNLRSKIRQASLAKTRLVMVTGVTGREIHDWLVDNLAEVFRVSGEDVAFVPLSDDKAVRNILIPKIVNKISKKQVALADVLPVFRDEVANRVINETARQNAVIGAAVFMPGVDMPILTLNQIKMVLRLAAVYRQELSVKRAAEILATVGGGFAFREVARQLLGFIPVGGWAVKGGVAYGGTVVMGQVAKKYFEREISNGKGDIVESLAGYTADSAQGGEAKPVHKSRA